LYVFRTWSLAARKGHILRMSDNGELRRIFGTKRKEVAGGWIRLHIEEFHKLYASTNIMRVMKLRG
jgi:hypothetical protein